MLTDEAEPAFDEEHLLAFQGVIARYVATESVWSPDALDLYVSLGVPDVVKSASDIAVRTAALCGPEDDPILIAGSSGLLEEISTCVAAQAEAGTLQRIRCVPIENVNELGNIPVLLYLDVEPDDEAEGLDDSGPCPLNYVRLVTNPTPFYMGDEDSPIRPT